MRSVPPHAVHECIDFGPPDVLLHPRPTALPRGPKDVGHAIRLGVLRIGTQRVLALEVGIPLCEAISDVPEKDEPKHHVFVLPRIHTAARRVSSPKLSLKAQLSPVRAKLLFLCHATLFAFLSLPHWKQPGP